MRLSIFAQRYREDNQYIKKSFSFIFSEIKQKKYWKNITIYVTIISIINKLKNIVEKERGI